MATSAQPMWERMSSNLSLPVLMKEMRVRMRGIRAPILLFISTALAISIGLIIIMSGWDSISANDSRSMVEVGVNLFTGIIILEGILCALIAPALTAGAISIEREQQTLDLLLLTRLSNMNILFGKLVSALSFIAIILISTLPVVAISFLLGGVDPAQLCWSAAIIFVTSCFFAAIGLYCSTRFKKTPTAVAVAYCICLAALVLLPLLCGATENFCDPTARQTFYLFITGASALSALFPTILACAVFILILRRPVPWLVTLICWLVFAAAVCGLLCMYPQQLMQFAKSSGSVNYLGVGNPILALLIILPGDNKLPGVSNFFVPLSVGILLVCMLVTQTLTIGEFMRLRK